MGGTVIMTGGERARLLDVVRATLGDLEPILVNNLPEASVLGRLSGERTWNRGAGRYAPQLRQAGLTAVDDASLRHLSFATIQYLPKGISRDQAMAAVRSLGATNYGNVALIATEDAARGATLLPGRTSRDFLRYPNHQVRPWAQLDEVVADNIANVAGADIEHEIAIGFRPFRYEGTHLERQERARQTLDELRGVLDQPTPEAAAVFREQLLDTARLRRGHMTEAHLLNPTWDTFDSIAIEPSGGPALLATMRDAAKQVDKPVYGVGALADVPYGS